MRVGAVVLHYRFWPEIRSTLAVLLAQTTVPDDVIVVDNQSGDGSVGELRRAFPRVEVIEAEANLGYGAGMNVGMARLLERGADAILLLTHECHLAPNALETMAGRLQSQPSLGAVGPLLGFRSKPERVYSAGGFIDRRWRPDRRRDPRLVTEWTGRPPHPVAWLDGACVLLRSAAIRTTGRIDEDYFLYFEETEYLLRLGDRGWSIECVPAAVAWQQPGQHPTYLWVRNRLRFLARSAPKRHLLRELGRLVAAIAKNSIFPDPRMTREQVQDQRRALLDFLRRRWGPDQVTRSGDPLAGSGQALGGRAVRAPDADSGAGGKP